MKRTFGISLLSAMLIMGQPFMALADTTGVKVLNFEDIQSIITEQNIDIQINQNDNLKTKVGYSDLKRNIKDLEDDIDDINKKRNRSSDVSQSIALGAEKSALLDALKQAERSVVDQPTVEAMADIEASMNNDSLMRTAEISFIDYNKAKLKSADISMQIKTAENKLAVMQLQESLGIISSNDMNSLKTQLVDMRTQLESNKFQQDSLERQLKNLLNDQENTLVIGSVPFANENFSIEDVDADLKQSLENNFGIKIKEQKIVMLQSTLDRAKKDHGLSSKEYKTADYELTNATLELAQLKDTLKSNYDTMVDDIAKMQNNLRLAEQNLNDKKVALSEAQIRLSLGMITQLEVDNATTEYQVQDNAVKTLQIELFNAKYGYNWFLKGMPWAV